MTENYLKKLDYYAQFIDMLLEELNVKEFEFKVSAGISLTKRK
jgi:hypothetical protein